LSKGYPKRNPKELNKQQLEKHKEKLLFLYISLLCQFMKQRAFWQLEKQNKKIKYVFIPSKYIHFYF
jgi:hypothetical protein